jgi:hypothetical protein
MSFKRIEFNTNFFNLKIKLWILIVYNKSHELHKNIRLLLKSIEFIEFKLMLDQKNYSILTSILTKGFVWNYSLNHLNSDLVNLNDN